MQVLLIDNYDSFTYNLVQLIRESGLWDLTVLPYNAVDESVIDRFDKIVISPGPGIPDDFPNLQKFIERFYASKSFLGVCLGHEAIGLTFGAELYNSGEVFHGISKTTRVEKSGHFFFNDIPADFKAGLYHSWALRKDKFPQDLDVLATADDGIIMAITHVEFDLVGVQFHPESIMTEWGSRMVRNWLLKKND